MNSPNGAQSLWGSLETLLRAQLRVVLLAGKAGLFIHQLPPHPPLVEGCSWGINSPTPLTSPICRLSHSLRQDTSSSRNRNVEKTKGIQTGHQPYLHRTPPPESMVYHYWPSWVGHQPEGKSSVGESPTHSFTCPTRNYQVTTRPQELCQALVMK